MPKEPPPSIPPLGEGDLTDRAALAAWARQFADTFATQAGREPGGEPGGDRGGAGAFLGRRRNPVIELPDPPLHPSLVTAKFMLDGAKPPIWRRVEIRGDLTLDALHRHLQAAMGWLDGHLHRFEPGPVKQRWLSPFFLTEFDIDDGEEGTPESEVRLDQVVRAVGDRLFYTYDFGDDWAHTLTVERLRPATADDPPMRCLKAVRACPPEDVGGIGAWNDLAAALRANPDPAALSGDLEMYADWLEPDVDPEHADVDDINLAIALVDADPFELMARLRDELGGDGEVALPQLHAAYQGVIDKAPPDLVVHLASLFALAAADDPHSPTEADLRALVRPWQTLLDVAGEDGIPLTKAGWMAPAACERIWREGGIDQGYGKGNREQFTPELVFVRETGVAARIVRVYRGRVVRTKLGYAATTDLDVLIGALAALLVRGPEGPDLDEAVLTVLLLATGPDDDVEDDPADIMGSSQRSDEFFDEVARLMTWLGWRVEGRPIHRHELRRARDITRILGLSTRGGYFSAVPSGPAVRAVAMRALKAP